MTDQRDKTSNGTQNPIPRTATAGELLAVKNTQNFQNRRFAVPKLKNHNLIQPFQFFKYRAF